MNIVPRSQHNYIRQILSNSHYRDIETEAKTCLTLLNMSLGTVLHTLSLDQNGPCLPWKEWSRSRHDTTAIVQTTYDSNLQFKYGIKNKKEWLG